MPEQTIADGLQRIINAKTDIDGAIEAKGGTVTKGLENSDEDIMTIPSGGGGSQPRKDVNFYDYDGTIVQSYSADEFANLAAMPENPSHEGLTAQGWNWSLSDAKTYVASYGRLEIGQMYITSDGKTRLYITLTEGRTSPVLQLYLNADSELDVDWGDGSVHSTFTSTSAGFVNERHNYLSEGDYIISIATISGSFELKSSSDNSSSILWDENGYSSSPDATYHTSLKKLEIGSGMSKIGYKTFSSYSALSTVIISNSVTTIANTAFSNCKNLNFIVIPNSITAIGISEFASSGLSKIVLPNTINNIDSNAFASCSNLMSIIIPDSVTSIAANAFISCTGLTSIKIPKSVNSIGNSCFSYTYSLATITIDKANGSISGSPWGAITSSPTSTQIIWTG